MAVLGSDLLQLMESSILTYRVFIKMDKKKSKGVHNPFGGHNKVATPLQQVRAAIDKVRLLDPSYPVVFLKHVIQLVNLRGSMSNK